MREAPAGAVLHLGAGEHRLSRPLTIDKPLSLLGEGMDKTRVLCDGEAYVVKLMGDGTFVVHDLSFEHEGSLWAVVVEVAGGEIDIRRCRFTGGVCRRSAGMSSDLVLDTDEAEYRGGSGLWLRKHTRGSVANCESVQNRLHGIDISSEAQPTLESNTCQENTHGILYDHRTAGIARRNTCKNNKVYGIHVIEDAHPTLELNDCNGNGEEDVNVWSRAHPTMVSPDVIRYRHNRRAAELRMERDERMERDDRSLPLSHPDYVQRSPGGAPPYSGGQYPTPMVPGSPRTRREQYQEEQESARIKGQRGGD